MRWGLRIDRFGCLFANAKQADFRCIEQTINENSISQQDEFGHVNHSVVSTGKLVSLDC
ncbi:hypothetical protein KOR42_44990 [Thalassoglobus neptunius]|uniref:Uncharacterized protein n=1 Tax=Thalassoglobus neptunius TaxID=1938619 RepID=A0A5C5VYQ6_9PLAN|nr:hypothetical protein KOR42_44990 [Thalassoglobus neptunius]